MTQCDSMCQLLGNFKFIGKVNVQLEKALITIMEWTTRIAARNKNQLNLKIKGKMLRDTSNCLFAIETLLKDTYIWGLCVSYDVLCAPYLA